jgi:hypothetical protein
MRSCSTASSANDAPTSNEETNPAINPVFIRTLLHVFEEYCASPRLFL